MLSKVFTYCCHKKESIFCSKLIISKDGKHKETSALRSRQKKKKTLGISEMYECLFSCLFKHPQIFSQENREVLFFCPPEGKKRKPRCVHSSLMVRKDIQAGHVFSGKGSYFILKGTAKTLRIISPEKMSQGFT